MRYETCRINLERFQQEGQAMLNRIIAVNETWARAYEPELKRQSSEWRHQGLPRRRKVRQNPSPTEVMVILAYDCQGVLVCHPVCEGLTVNAAYYSSFLVYQLHHAASTKCPELLDNAIILHNNAIAHTAATVQHRLQR